MPKYIKALIIILLIITATASTTAKAADTITINDLVEKAKEMDGKEVTIQAEAIGESMNRSGDYSWINVNDGTNAIGVWALDNEAKEITCYGNYKNKGDIAIITGTFHRACKEHGGEADIHLSSIKIVEKGHPLKNPIPTGKIIAAVVLAPAVLLFALYYFKRVKK